MQSKMFIPDTIKVGYQDRKDTYTGKLAYIIYYDTKGVLRKENSWQSWRDDKHPAEDFSNEPTSGFVLNRGVGGARQSYGWNTRNEYVRVYDPRGFEFEISVSNLLFILQECTSTKGKGLEGEFVYCWNGTELVLLPVDCLEYRSCITFTEAKTRKVQKSDMVEGCEYIDKQLDRYIYIGRLPHSSELTGYSVITAQRIKDLGEHVKKHKHIFYKVSSDQSQSLSYTNFVAKTGFTHLSSRETMTPSPLYPELFMFYSKSRYMGHFSHVELVPSRLLSESELTKEDFSHLYQRCLRTLVMLEDTLYYFIVRDRDMYGRRVASILQSVTSLSDPKLKQFEIGQDQQSLITSDSDSTNYYSDRTSKYIDFETLNRLFKNKQLYSIVTILNNGAVITGASYVK